MSSRKKKEEERIIERIIRSLLKLPENRRCINCNDLGPKYVCTTFWTFVCSSCSGIHRKFTHRVKSVSMAKFNAEEVSALQAGGNERAREIYFKEWDPQLHSFPDRSNQNKLRDFIRRVYVDRKFTGERSMGRLAMVKGGDREDSSEWHSIERPSPGGRIEDRSLKYYINERGSPHYKLNTIRSLGHRNHPVNFEIVDDRFQDDQFGSRWRSEIHRASNEQPRARSMPLVSQKGKQKITPPEVHAVWDTLSENGPSFQSCTSSLVSNAQGRSSASAKELSQASSKVAQDNNSGVGSQALQVEAKPSERKELPAVITILYCTLCLILWHICQCFLNYMN